MQSSTSHMSSGLPSPTLTNPDMILPYDAPSPSSNPSTPRRAQRPPSPPLLDIANAIHSNDTEGIDHMKGAVRNWFRNGERSKLRKARKTEDVALDVEGTSRDNQMPPNGTNGSSVLASSPILHDGYAIPMAGTAMLEEGAERQWRDFSSLADGDATSPYSEDSHESVLDLGRPKYGFPPLDNEKNGFSAPPDVEGDNLYSHAAMSIRAEQILANAKKRLTNMEGNLNRARSTLHSRPSSSMSSLTNHSKEPVSMYTLPKSNSSPSKHRQAHSPPSAGSNKGHARIFSESSVPSTLNTPFNQRQENGTQAPRSSSAMGSTTIERSEDESLENSRNWFWTGLTRNTSHAHKHNYSLPALDEDGPALASFEPMLATGRISEENEPSSVDLDRATKASEFDAQNPPAQGLTRARSTTQMRDLRDQMQDLKGKMSSLKKRAREDSMRRRSLQSLRIPSPFTAAERWYSDTAPSQSQASIETASNARDFAREHGAILEEGNLPASEKSETGITPEAEDKRDETDLDLTPRNNKTMHVEKPGTETPQDRSASGLDVAREHSPSNRNGYQSEDQPPDSGIAEIEVEEEEEEDSLYGDHDYHETSPSPLGERHEDRPDAFDYEHFFLHSGTGTLAHKDLSRSSSRSSIYSVETTKPSTNSISTASEPPTTEEDDSSETPEATPKRATPHPKGGHGHSRSGSVASISTVATYATATEGKGSDADSSASDDEWILHHPIAGSWQSDHLKRKHHPPSDSSPKRHATPKTMAANPIPSIPSPYRHEAAPQPSLNLMALLEAALPPNHDEGATPSLQLSDGDRNLVEKLLSSLARVCARMQAAEADAEGGRYAGRVWRRRLDSAKRVLDGEKNGELF